MKKIFKVCTIVENYHNTYVDIAAVLKIAFMFI